MLLREALREARGRLAQAGAAEADTDAWLLLSWCLDMSLADYALHSAQELDPADEKRYFAAVGRRAERIPLQYITGEQEFMGLPMKVTPDVLIPRQDTETAVQECLRRLGGEERVLDLCTGSGCILISLLHACPGLSGVGADISGAALQVARENARRNGVSAQFVEGDLFEPVEGQFDLIVSNPPYIPTGELGGLEAEVRDHEPVLALDGSSDGLLFYRRITAEAPRYLRRGGFLVYEIGWDQGEAVKDILEQAGFGEVTIVRDLAGLPRVAVARYGAQPQQQRRDGDV